MPNKCCAVNCKSGYVSSVLKNVTFHSFPFHNEELLKLRIRRISRKNYYPTKHSRLCSLHFIESDFLTSSVDSNTTRKKSKEDTLKLKRLKPNAAPSLFPNLPKYLSQDITQSTRRDNHPSSSRRQDLQQERADTMEHDLFEDEKISTLNDLATKLQKEKKPSAWTIFNRPSSILLLRMDLSEDVDQARLLSSIVIGDDLNVKVFHREKVVKKEMYQHIVHRESIESVCEVLNLMAYLNAFTEEGIVVRDQLKEAIECLEVTNYLFVV